MPLNPANPTLIDFFRHARAAIDALEKFVSEETAGRQKAELSRVKPATPTVQPVSAKADDARLAYTIKEACRKIGISRSTLYQAMSSKRLRAVKSGRRTLILATDLQRWMDSWPDQ